MSTGCGRSGMLQADPPTPTLVPVVTPTGDGPLSVSLAQIDFGSVPAGAPAEQVIELTNAGEIDLNLTLSFPTNPGEQYSASSEGGPVPDRISAGATVSIRVAYQPNANGEAPGTLRIDTNASLSPRIDVPLFAIGAGIQPDDDHDGYSVADGDCDDLEANIHPEAPEACDGIDNNCDGSTDEEGVSTFYVDSDGDAHGDPASAFLACNPGVGTVTVGDDCNDADHNDFPGAPELCDGIDNNCDGSTDEDSTRTFYLDQDGDGFGDTQAFVTGCEAPAQYVLAPGDCDDQAANVYPQAFEACDGVDNDCDAQLDEDGSTTFYLDIDGDGHGDPLTAYESCSPGPNSVPVGDDCDDASSQSYHGAAELCDGQDNDCDGNIDDGATSRYFEDRDADGFGDSESVAVGCSAPDGYSPVGGDCSDNDAAVHPGAEEICDEIDNDCDDKIDPGIELTWYQDLDGDQHGDRTVFVSACAAPAGYVADNTDCYDDDVSIHAGAFEACDGKDNDCNGVTDELGQQTWFQDSDGDGFGGRDIFVSACSAPAGFVLDHSDCGDGDAAVYPGADEACDGKDNDCNSQIDEADQQTWFKDTDGDGFGNPDASVQACAQPAGYVSDATDCNDKDALVYPAAAEACDSKDNDCDSKIDEDGVSTFYRDYDQDGHGDPAATQVGCSIQADYVTTGDDCNDRDNRMYPGNAEACDGKDNNCDAQIDEGVLKTWYSDGDNDSYGDSAVELTACSQPTGFAELAGDCNDRDKSVFPGATELCDSKDNDCNGQSDEGVQTTWYLDADRDGVGDANNTVLACAQPGLYVHSSGDCNDLDKTVYPSAPEQCDGKDNNCDKQIDEGVLLTFYADTDQDGFGDATVPSSGCSVSRGTVQDSSDCDDARSSVHPGASEACDGLDNDCNSQIDEGVKKTFYGDADSDGFGVSSISTQACSSPDGYVTSSSDCDDASPTTFPGAPEVCDGKDNNCNATVDEDVKNSFFADADKDSFGDPDNTIHACKLGAGMVTNNIDCDDQDVSIHPGAPELCDAQDNDCDAQTDEPGDSVQHLYYRDADNDGHGKSSPTLYGCSAPSGYAASQDDCDDANPSTYPGAVEQCQGDDNNCDGIAGPPAAPVATNNGPVCEGANIQLSVSGSGGTFDWTGPGGFVSSLQNPTIASATSANAGTYSVVAKAGGCSAPVATTTVSVISTSAAFTPSATSANLNDPITFTPTQSGATYAWSFPDGTPATSSAQTPVVSWSAPGSYTVSLTVTNQGCSSTSSVTIQINSSPTSCKAIKDAYPSSADGLYTIDPDGSGPEQPFDTLCDMTTNGGGWTLIYYVDAAHFDGYVANNKVAQNSPITALNSSADMFNPPASMTVSETIFGCTQQDDAARFAWTYAKADPAVWYTNTTKDYGFPAITSAWTDSTYTAKCMAANKAESGFGFITIETGTSCGTCQNMLFGGYYYANGGTCNSTDTTYGTHTSPYRAKSIGYPLCNKKQTSNGKFWIGVR